MCNRGARLRFRARARVHDRREDRGEPVHRAAHGYRQLQIQQHLAAVSRDRRPAPHRRRRSGGDVPAGLCVRTGRPAAHAARCAHTLEVDSELGLAWLSVPAEAMEQYGLRSEDLDGVVEHARSIEGTRLALFFRDLGYGKVKVSFRSTGEVDVNRFARTFGGGGHARAAGALIPGALADVRQRVIDEARTYLAAGAPA